jgi:hypothetical protein
VTYLHILLLEEINSLESLKRAMGFKVIIKQPSVPDDEHTYYGIVFPNRDIGQIKQLEYVSPKLEATFEFDEDKVKVNEHFLAILVPVDESEIKEGNCSKLACKIGTNSAPHVPEVVNFP